MNASTIATIAFSFSAGLLVGVVMAMSRAQQAHRFIEVIKRWANEERMGDRGWTYRQARAEIRVKIYGYEEGL
jgi:hypothetical protein